MRMVAAGHRMVANGWAMFEQAIEGAGEGDLPQLLCHLKGWRHLHHHHSHHKNLLLQMMYHQHHHQQKKIKPENLGDQPVVVMVGGVIHGPAPNVIWLGGEKTAATPTYGRSTQEKPLCVPSAVFPHTIWIHCRGTKRNTIDLFYFNLSFDNIVNKEQVWQNIHCIGFIWCQTGRTNKRSWVNEYKQSVIVYVEHVRWNA